MKDLVDWAAMIWLMLIKMVKKKVLDEGDIFLIGISVGCAIAFLVFALILGAALYYKFHKHKRVNIAPSRNSVLNFQPRDIPQVGSTRRDNIRNDSAVISRANLIDNEQRIAVSSNKSFDDNDISIYETIYPTPDRPIKSSVATFPRMLKPARIPRRHEVPVMGSNAAMSRAGFDPEGRSVTGSGYLTATESGGATYLTIIDSTEPLFEQTVRTNHCEDTITSDASGFGYISMADIPRDAPQGFSRSDEDNVLEDDDYVNMNGDVGEVTKRKRNADINGAREGGENRCGGNANVIGDRDNIKYNNIQVLSPGYLARSPLKQVSADDPMESVSIEMRETGMSRDPEYSKMRETRELSDAYYINVKPDGRISWASDEDGHLQARYPSESDEPMTPAPVGNSSQQTYERMKQW